MGNLLGLGGKWSRRERDFQLWGMGFELIEEDGEGIKAIFCDNFRFV